MTALGASLALGFIHSGIYPIAASTPHMAPFRWVVTTLQRRSVEVGARNVVAPPLDDPALVEAGFHLYQEQCLVCHGAPGVERGVIGRGMNPNPPRLAYTAPDWSDGEIYWIIRNGIKMGGMPAFWTANTPQENWALAAFTRRLPELTEEQYGLMVARSQGTAVDPSRLAWAGTGEEGFAEMLAEGNAAEGARLLAAYGCGSCHVIPGVREARGLTGPPLTRWAERHEIAGLLLNTPRNLTAWIIDPQRFEPGTAMPTLGVSAPDAQHMAAYLFTLGAAPRQLLNALRRIDR
jgi:mono/diheme cytochrome c family protein